MASLDELLKTFRSMTFEDFQNFSPSDNETRLAYRMVQDERLKALRAKNAKGIRENEKLKKELARLNREVEELSYEAKRLQELNRLADLNYTHNGVREIKAADALASDLDKAGERLRKKLPKTARTALQDPDFTAKKMRDAMAKDLLDEAGKMAKPMQNFLAESVGPSGSTFARPDYGLLYGGADDAVIQIARYGPEAASEYAGDLSKFVLKQVDDTQTLSGLNFMRHVDAGGCKWCYGQVAEYAATKEFKRHKNCKCMKVRD